MSTIITPRYRLTRRGQIIKAALTGIFLSVCVGAFWALTTLVLSLYLASTGAPR